MKIYFTLRHPLILNQANFFPSEVPCYQAQIDSISNGSIICSNQDGFVSQLCIKHLTLSTRSFIFWHYYWCKYLLLSIYNYVFLKPALTFFFFFFGFCRTFSFQHVVIVFIWIKHYWITKCSLNSFPKPLSLKSTFKLLILFSS